MLIKMPFTKIRGIFLFGIFDIEFMAQSFLTFPAAL